MNTNVVILLIIGTLFAINLATRIGLKIMQTVILRRHSWVLMLQNNSKDTQKQSTNTNKPKKKKEAA